MNPFAPKHRIGDQVFVLVPAEGKPRMMPCDRCDGTGVEQGDYDLNTCWACDGKKRFAVPAARIVGQRVGFAVFFTESDEWRGDASNDVYYGFEHARNRDPDHVDRVRAAMAQAHHADDVFETRAQAARVLASPSRLNEYAKRNHWAGAKRRKP